ncbi:MAG TPA: hypothetical protein DCX61_00305, partial [Gemmatimonadetes bacterium]|nr:hypothetical protein [Gemmatimonadota bacterium]
KDGRRRKGRGRRKSGGRPRSGGRRKVARRRRKGRNKSWSIRKRWPRPSSKQKLAWPRSTRCSANPRTSNELRPTR